MTKLKIGITVLFFTLIAVAILALAPKQDKQSAVEGEPFAVVELFTSEGCSSCPPADALLADIVKKARENDKRIFALAFHVTYWNRLGWKDIYSRTEYSERQRDYARELGSGVYTPQMIVNGKVQFVGSNERKARNSIENSLENPAPVVISLSKVNVVKKDKLKLHYKVNGNFSDAVIHFAVVERGIVSNIGSGENSGRTLRHENVVRAFRTVKLKDGESSVTVSFPDEVDVNKASVIAYVQNESTKEILGAASKDLN